MNVTSYGSPSPRLRYSRGARRLYVTPRRGNLAHTYEYTVNTGPFYGSRRHRNRGRDSVNRYTLSAARRGLSRQQQLDEVREYRQGLPPALNAYVARYI